MKRLALLIALLCAVPALAGEQLTLTTPVVKTTSAYTVKSLYLSWSDQQISVTVVDANGFERQQSYAGATAVTLMTALNKADLSVKSPQRRIMERLIADGVLTGTVGGTPD